MLFIILTVLFSVVIYLVWKYVQSDELPELKPIARGVSFLCFATYVALNCLVIVPPGTVYNGILFGTVQQKPFKQGLNFVNPLLNFTAASVRRQITEFQSRGVNDPNAEQVVSLSKDNLLPRNFKS
jgi:regulator of protease activity HflC (stomatin/prohibitin superfamily)